MIACVYPVSCSRSSSSPLPAAAQDLACRAAQKPMVVIDLMFGRNIGGRLGVTEARWSRFLADEITPRFPDGLTVVDASGQWRAPGQADRARA